MTEPTSAARRGSSTARQRAWWFPVLQGWVIGLVFISVYLAAFHHPTPHGARVLIVGSRDAARLQRLAHASEPGAFSFGETPSLSDAERAIRLERALAAVVGGSHPEIVIAGANGPSARAVITTLLAPLVSGASGARAGPAVIDARPLRPQDSAGLSLFYLTFGTVLAAYLFAISSVALGAALSPAAHWANAAAVALLLGATGAVLAGPVYGVIPNHDAPLVAMIAALLALAVSGTTAMLLTLSRTFGTLIGTIVLLTIGTASAGVVPSALLPVWAQAARHILANGLALDAIRGVVYFHDHSLVPGLIGLLLWAVVPVIVIEIATRRGRRRTTPDHDRYQPSPQGAPT